MYSKHFRALIHGRIIKALSLLLTLALMSLCFYYAVPNPAIILLTSIVICTFIGGFTCGTISGLITIIYCIYFFSIPDNFLTFTPDNLYRVNVIFIAIPIMIFIVGYLKKTIDLRTKELEKINKKLSTLVDIDGLTEIPNRRRFDTVILAEWKRSQRNGHPLSIAIMDIDFFKNYNDTYGHLQGDNCLKQVAKAIINVPTRPSDFVARYGGEEFVVVLPIIEINGAITVCERLRQAVQELSIPHTASCISPYITISIGVTTIIPGDDGCTLHDFVRQADIALYKAKGMGRNIVEVFNSDMIND